MTLEFIDGSKLEVISIRGGPKLIRGVMRDTLQIRVDPKTIDFMALKAQFHENPKCRTLFTYNEVVDEETGKRSVVKDTIGEGYTIFVSIADEEERVAHPPGRLLPDVVEEVYIVTIAQMTYAEFVAATIPT